MRSLLLISLLLCGCASVEPRAAHSSYACMQAVRAQIPVDLPDKRQHCLASARITRQCSIAEAWLAGLGKELRDVFGAGDAAWSDWRADRAGLACGRQVGDAQQIETCCEQAGF